MSIIPKIQMRNKIFPGEDPYEREDDKSGNHGGIRKQRREKTRGEILSQDFPHAEGFGKDIPSPHGPFPGYIRDG
jgi:hypothetical protein